MPLGVYLALIIIGFLISGIGSFFYGNMVRPYGVAKYPDTFGSGFSIVASSNNGRVYCSLLSVRISGDPGIFNYDVAETEWKEVQIEIRIAPPLPNDLYVRVPWRIEHVPGGGYYNSSYNEESDCTFVFIKPEQQIWISFNWDVMTRVAYDKFEMNIDLVPWFDDSELQIDKFNLEIVPPPSSTLDMGETIPLPSRVTKEQWSISGSSAKSKYVWSFSGQNLIQRKDAMELLHTSLTFSNKRYEKENWIFFSGILFGAGLSLSISSSAELTKWIAEYPELKKILRQYLKKLKRSKKKTPLS